MQLNKQNERINALQTSMEQAQNKREEAKNTAQDVNSLVFPSINQYRLFSSRNRLKVNILN